MKVWGLIGASNIAEKTMVNVFRFEGSEIASVYSTNAQQAETFAKRNAIPQFTNNLQQLLEDPQINCVYISSTNEKHYPQTLAAIQAKKHILCEKPLALSLEEAKAMVQQAQKAGVVMATNHPLRSSAGHIRIHQLLEQHTIGKLLTARVFHAIYLPAERRGWRLDNPKIGGGAILDILVHDADTIRFHLGLEPEKVTAVPQYSAMSQGCEDGVMSVWQMPEGITVQTHESFSHQYAMVGMEFYGEQGAIIAKNMVGQEPKIQLFTGGQGKEVGFITHDPYRRLLNDFYQAIDGQGKPSSDGTDGLKSLAIALAVKQSAETETMVNVDYGGY